MKRRGFTLIELLVVIAIILLLMTILIPSLTAMRRKGLRLTDLSNIRQMSIALLAMSQNSNGNIPRGDLMAPYHEDDMVWICGPTVTSLITDYSVEKRALSCITLHDSAFYESTVEKLPELYYAPDTIIGWMYWGSRRLVGPNGRMIINPDGTNSGVPYKMPRRLSSPMTTRTLITCMAYVYPGSAWPGWIPHTIDTETGTTVPALGNPFDKKIRIAGLNMGFVDGSARWVPQADFGAIRDVDFVYYDRTAK